MRIGSARTNSDGRRAQAAEVERVESRPKAIRTSGFNRLLFYLFPEKEKDKDKDKSSSSRTAYKQRNRRHSTALAGPSLSIDPSSSTPSEGIRTCGAENCQPISTSSTIPNPSSNLPSTSASASTSTHTPTTTTAQPGRLSGRQSRIRASRLRPSTAPAASVMVQTFPTFDDPPLEIHLSDDVVVLRGTGSDFEPAVIRGFLRLSLPEDTDLRQVSIRCTAKARVSVLLKEDARSQVQTTLLYTKETDFLEGDKSHPHTLKAGRHDFPFAYELDSRDAASISANFGMATIEYRLRAIAVRPSFSTNFVTEKAFTVVRSFSNEALEFQQTLEIENVWPEKVQYSVILPHKAWAAGDHISAILKFTPLSKGVKVAKITMGLQEKVKTVWKTLPYEDVRVVCQKKQSVRNGQLVERRTSNPYPSASAGAGGSNSHTSPSSPQNQSSNLGHASVGEAAAESSITATANGSQRRNGTSFFRRVGSRAQSRENLLGLLRTRTGDEISPGGSGSNSTPATPPAVEGIPFGLAVASRVAGAIGATGTNDTASAVGTGTGAGAGTSRDEPPESTDINHTSPSSLEGEEGNEPEDTEVVMRMMIPVDVTPSHNIAPIWVSHRIKWDVLISNLDGHYSELRCSLPIHLLAKEVLEETLVATNATRTALLGESHGVPIQEVVLPAYHDHIRDRVAVAEFQDHGLAANPLSSAQNVTTPDEILPVAVSSSYNPTSTLSEQMARNGSSAAIPRVTSLPDASERGRTRLGWPTEPYDPTASELYLSLGRRPETANPTATGMNTPGSRSNPPSQSSSRASSPGPDRPGDSGHRSRLGLGGLSIRPFTAFKSKSNNNNSSPSNTSSSRPGSRPGSSHGASTNRSGGWSIGGHKYSSSRSSNGPSAPSSPDRFAHSTLPLPIPEMSGMSGLPGLPGGLVLPRSNAGSPTSTQLSLGHYAPEYYDAVPDYAIAARGFLGGGIIPLSSLRGLPSYDQAQRSRGNSPLTTQNSMTATITSIATTLSQGSETSQGSSRNSHSMGSPRLQPQPQTLERHPSCSPPTRSSPLSQSPPITTSSSA